MTRPAIDTLAAGLAEHRRDDELLSGRDFDEAVHDELDEALASLRRLVKAAAHFRDLDRRAGGLDGDAYEDAGDELDAALAGCMGDPAPVPGAEEGQRDG